MQKGTENLERKSSAGRRVDEAALREVIEPVTLSYGLELVAVELSGDLLRVIIDRVAAASALSADAPPAGEGSSAHAPLAQVPMAGLPVAGVAPAKARPAKARRVKAPLAQGGVSLDDCVHVSRDLSVALDVADLIPHAYRLEVSSPGADRRLTTSADYSRNVGRLAKCKLIAAAPDGQMVLRGPILGATETSVRIEVDGKTHEALLTNIREAKLVFEVGGAPKPGKHKPGKNKPAKTNGSHPRGRSRHG